MDEPPTIRLPLFTNGLLVRRIVPDDFHALRAYWCDPEVARYQFWGPYSDEQVTAMIEGQVEVEPGDPGVALLLAAVVDDTLIGDCQLTVSSVEDRQAEIAYTFNPRFTGRGLATQAVTAVMGFGYVQLGLHRIVCSMDSRNERSWRLAERVGMRREAHFHHDNFIKGEWMDSFVYAMLEEEWCQRHAELVVAVAVER